MNFLPELSATARWIILVFGMLMMVLSGTMSISSFQKKEMSWSFILLLITLLLLILIILELISLFTIPKKRKASSDRLLNEMPLIEFNQRKNGNCIQYSGFRDYTAEYFFKPNDAAFMSMATNQNWKLSFDIKPKKLEDHVLIMRYPHIQILPDGTVRYISEYPAKYHSSIPELVRFDQWNKFVLDSTGKLTVNGVVAFQIVETENMDLYKTKIISYRDKTAPGSSSYYFKPTLILIENVELCPTAENMWI